ncbi:PREDICTED: uncharacterized protein LOC108778291 [Cyphomyrmex costatus]|uniref:uncharacterized protein LOC108778291 n=1 Tax=Cyphomyrmex costatus TaxID=456900 RepID=UPI0008522E93|nr:PREDICTED: uncharacterized protein LOC108778291 [Cyphomyrmex costatus]
MHEKPGGYMTLKDAIELITGYTISEIDNAILCDICFYKVESYIKFRSQLVASFGRLNNIQISDLDSSDLKNVDITNTSLFSKITNTESEIPKEIMNINENNVSSNCSNLSSRETTNDSCYTNSPSNFHHYVDNVSDYGSDIDDNLNVDIARSRIQKSDIESDINVCSGEDDEVLELPVEYKHSEAINISSTESEEDYDYGPTFKKIKLSNRISSPVISS